MKINKHNYEAYFVDYSEGNLSGDDLRDLLLFLEQNPHLKEELEAYETITLPVTKDVFEFKNALKKPVYTDEVLIAYLENDLSEAEKRDIEKDAAEQKDLHKEIVLYKKTVSVPDKTIIYEHKEKLKKRAFILVWNKPVNYLAIAAAILLLVGLFVLYSKQANIDNGVDLQKNRTDVNQQNKIPETIASARQKETKEPVVLKEQKATIAQKTIYPGTKKQVKGQQQEEMQVVADTYHNVHDSLQKQDVLLNRQAHTEIAQDTLNKLASNETEELSYFNHSTDMNDAMPAKQQPTEVAKTKKTFFGVLSAAVKGAKKLGVKQVDVKEGGNENTVTIGGLAFSETKSH